MPIAFPLIRAALFQFPPEKAHDMAVRSLSRLPRVARSLLRHRQVRSDRLQQNLFGVDFPNPVGLAAGFDKGAVAFNALGSLGFGFVEIGTITAHAQEGNPKPRIFRIPEDQALLNRMGFNNPGADAAALSLSRQPAETVIGVNIGKSKVTPLDEAVDDYLHSLERLREYADYLVVNVSSPNTPGLRELQDAEPLRELLTAVTEAAVKPNGAPIPVLVKLAPDLDEGPLEEAVDIAVETGCSGIVAVNTTTSREGLRMTSRDAHALGAGGVSGGPLRIRAHQMVSRIYRQVDGQIPIIGVGGIFSAEDAWERIRSGASLVQVYTGFIYQGPDIIRSINSGLLKRMDRHGYRNIAEVVGTVGD